MRGRPSCSRRPPGKRPHAKSLIQVVLHAPAESSPLLALVSNLSGSRYREHAMRIPHQFFMIENCARCSPDVNIHGLVIAHSTHWRPRQSQIAIAERKCNAPNMRLGIWGGVGIDCGRDCVD